MSFSLVEYFGEQNKSRCGYCDNTRSSYSHGMHAHTMECKDYQELVDRGWRRSGHYTYKPNNAVTCCPCYTIRCNVNDFKLSRSHKKILKKMKRFLAFGSKGNEVIDDDEGTRKEISTSVGYNEKIEIPNREKAKINIDNILVKKFKKDTNDESNLEKTESGPSSEALPCSETQKIFIKHPQKKKIMRLERKKGKVAENQTVLEHLDSGRNKNLEKTLSDYINDVSENDRHKLKIKLIPSSDTEAIINQELNLYQKYQIVIHNDPPTKPTEKQFLRFLCNSPLQLKIVNVKSDDFFSTLATEYSLYQKYQTVIHNDSPANVQEFIDFLQESPLKMSNDEEDSPPDGYGSFHQQYWLDDKLIAVGVIDVLPHCLSSVYFFYDPDYSFLSLGTYASLREIHYTRNLNTFNSSIKFYYMGFYIHSCPKMRYKGNLSASYLLCPEKYTWHLLSNEIREKLDKKKYQIFNTNPSAHVRDEFGTEDLNSVLILYQSGKFLNYKTFKMIKRTNVDDKLLEYGKLVGKTLAHRMLFVEL